MAPDRSRQLLNKVKEYKADLASLKDQLVKARSANSEYDATRAELVGVAGLAHGMSTRWGPRYILGQHCT